MRNGIAATMRLSAALLVEAGRGLRHPGAAVRKLRTAVSVWFSGLGTDGIVAEVVHERRLATCRKCPVFFRPLRTCGSWLSKETRDLGTCGCNMEAAAWFRHKRCYLDDLYHGEPHYGWNE